MKHFLFRKQVLNWEYLLSIPSLLVRLPVTVADEHMAVAWELYFQEQGLAPYIIFFPLFRPAGFTPKVHSFPCTTLIKMPVLQVYLDGVTA